MGVGEVSYKALGDAVTTTKIAGGGSPPILVTGGQWEIMAEILRRYAGGRPVWAYGSRARGDVPGNRVKKYSDLDLVVGGEPFRGLEEWKLERRSMSRCCRSGWSFGMKRS